MSSDNQSTPLEIPLEVTFKCNYTCKHCFNKNTPQDSRELVTVCFIRIINKIADANVEAIRFTGGEPLLRNDIFTLIEHAKSKGLYTIMNTNGLLVNERIAERLKGIVDDVLIPINSLGNAEEQEFSGESNSFTRKLESIKLLKNVGIERVRSCTIISEKNVDKLGEIIKLVESLKLDHWGVLRPVPTKENSFISNILVEKTVDQLIKFKGNYKFINAIPFCSYDPEKVERVAIGSKFDDCSLRITVAPDGKVKPNYYMDENLGDITKQELNECWNNEFARKLRNFELVNEVCKNCKYLRKCGGGLRFAANLINGSYSSLDPLAMPEKFKEKLFTSL